MNTQELIKKLTTVPKNDDVSSIKVLIRHDVESEERTKIEIPTPRPARNSYLAVFDDESMIDKEQSSFNSQEFVLDEANIISSVLQDYGCEVPANTAIETLFLMRQEKSAEKKISKVDKWLVTPKESEDKFAFFKTSPILRNGINSINTNPFIKETSKSEGGKCQRVEERVEFFSRNVLMRSLLLNRMESTSLGSSSTSTSGKDHDSDSQLNTPEYMEMIDEPDVLLRPEMVDRDVLEGIPGDDGFRFEHHGVKKTVTPRQYLMDCIDDGDLIFKKKKSLRTRGFFHLSQAFRLSINFSGFQ